MKFVLPAVISIFLFFSACGNECPLIGRPCNNKSSNTNDIFTADLKSSADVMEETSADIFEEEWNFQEDQKDATEDKISFCYYPETATSQQITAFTALNEYRNMVGLSCIDENEKINKAAQAHANYYILHYDEYDSSYLSPHKEDPKWSEGFTGINFWDRMQYFDYIGTGGWEIISFNNNPVKAVDSWMETLYHRLPMIHPHAKEFGYGNAGKGMLKIDVMDFGSGPSTSELEYILYPSDGQINVPKSWDGLESPQPPPPPSGYPSGPIITVIFNAKAGFTIYTHTLSDESSQAMEHMFLAPFADEKHNILKDSMLDNELAMYSYFPLSSNMKYTVNITGERGGNTLDLKWSFTTGYK